jgi:pimeloyl-ACP methyl ester carboxylesterase
VQEFDVAVPGGDLRVVAWGDGPVVLAAHGITANALAWARVAELLDGRVRLVAPDLRGRARSNTLGGPYGMAAHAADLIAVADHLGLDRVPLAGHSMGGFVVATTAAAYPDRVCSVLLVDGGVALPVPPGLDVDAVLTAVIGPAMQRLSMTFPTEQAYLGFFRGHPALGPSWGPGAEAYVRRDLAGSAPEFRSSCDIEAVRGDAADTLVTDETVTAVHHLSCPARLMWAEGGMLGEPPGLYTPQRLTSLPFPAEFVPGVNHYTILLDDAGAQRVADRIAGLVV